MAVPARASGTRGTYVLLGALTAFGPLSMDLYLTALPEMARDLPASASAAQLTLTTSMVGLALGQVLAGPISDARGRRGPLLTGVAVFALASALCAVAPSIWVLLVLRLLQGMAGGTGPSLSRRGAGGPSCAGCRGWRAPPACPSPVRRSATSPRPARRRRGSSRACSSCRGPCRSWRR